MILPMRVSIGAMSVTLFNFTGACESHLRAQKSACQSRHDACDVLACVRACKCAMAEPLQCAVGHGATGTAVFRKQMCVQRTVRNHALLHEACRSERHTQSSTSRKQFNNAPR